VLRRTTTSQASPPASTVPSVMSPCHAMASLSKQHKSTSQACSHPWVDQQRALSNPAQQPIHSVRMWSFLCCSSSSGVRISVTRPGVFCYSEPRIGGRGHSWLIAFAPFATSEASWSSLCFRLWQLAACIHYRLTPTVMREHATACSQINFIHPLHPVTGCCSPVLVLNPQVAD
jgi:hypothetical protein